MSITLPDNFWTREVGDGVVVRATQRADSPLLDTFMTGYDRAFVLPDEREEIDGFRACLAMNDQSFSRFGRRHSEMVLVIEDADSGELLGGANFLATRMVHVPPGYPAVSVALNYLFIEAAHRGRGLSRLLKHVVEEIALEAVECRASAPSPALFIEQNDPFRLTEAEYVTDNSHAGIDQIDRLAVWARLGAKLVDFDYEQPALSANQESDDNLAYAVLNFPREAIDAAWFAAHLESFFGISVLKGRSPAADPVASRQLRDLAAMAVRGEQVPCLSMHQTIEQMRSGYDRSRYATMRSFARSLE